MLFYIAKIRQFNQINVGTRLKNWLPPASKKVWLTVKKSARRKIIFLIVSLTKIQNIKYKIQKYVIYYIFVEFSHKNRMYHNSNDFISILYNFILISHNFYRYYTIFIDFIQILLILYNFYRFYTIFIDFL